MTNDIEYRICENCKFSCNCEYDEQPHKCKEITKAFCKCVLCNTTIVYNIKHPNPRYCTECETKLARRTYSSSGNMKLDVFYRRFE